MRDLLSPLYPAAPPTYSLTENTAAHMAPIGGVPLETAVQGKGWRLSLTEHNNWIERNVKKEYHRPKKGQSRET